MRTEAAAVLTLLFAASIAPAHGDDWRETYAAALDHVRSAAASQKRIDAANRGADARRSDLENARLSSDIASQRLEELKREQRQRAAEITAFEQRLRDAEITRVELLPLLNDMLDALEKFIEDDLPFAVSRRRARVKDARAQLQSHRLSLEQKMLAVFELYRDEIDAGSQMATQSARIDLDGQPLKVNLLRAGRVGLYFMTPDETTVGTWNKSTGKWHALPQRYSQSIATAISMTDTGRMEEAAGLPVFWQSTP